MNQKKHIIALLMLTLCLNSYPVVIDEDLRYDPDYHLESIDQVPSWTVSIMNKLLYQKTIELQKLHKTPPPDSKTTSKRNRDLSPGYENLPPDVRMKGIIISATSSDLAYELGTNALASVYPEQKNDSPLPYVKLVNQRRKGLLLLFGYLKMPVGCLLQEQLYCTIITNLKKEWSVFDPKKNTPLEPLFQCENDEFELIVRNAQEASRCDATLLNHLAKKLMLPLLSDNRWLNTESKELLTKEVYCWIEKDKYSEVISKLGLEIAEIE